MVYALDPNNSVIKRLWCITIINTSTVYNQKDTSCIATILLQTSIENPSKENSEIEHIQKKSTNLCKNEPTQFHSVPQTESCLSSI